MRASRLGVGLLDREVVDQRDRLGADADDVVDVHRDAVDADGVEPVGLLGDDQLRADPVGRRSRSRGSAPRAARSRSARAAGRTGWDARARSCAARRRARRRRSSARPVSTPAAAYASLIARGFCQRRRTTAASGDAVGGVGQQATGRARPARMSRTEASVEANAAPTPATNARGHRARQPAAGEPRALQRGRARR